jgi:hypothetical protein
MKLTLNREWFETRIQPNENYEVGAGVPSSAADCSNSAKGEAQGQMSNEEFAEKVLLSPEAPSA